MTAKSKPYAIIEIACGGASCSVCNITSSMLHGRRQSTTSNLARRFGQCGQHAAGRARTGAAGHRDAGAGGSVGEDFDHRSEPGAIFQPCRQGTVSREVTPAGVCWCWSAGWHSGSSPTQVVEAHLAFQAEPSAPPPHPETSPRGHELAGLRGPVAPTREPDGVVQRRGDQGVGG